MGFEFTYLQFVRSSTRSTVDADTQICEIVKNLSGKIKNWFVIAPTPQTRVLYFEPDEGYTKMEAVKGSSADMRKVALGRNSLKKKRSKK